MPGINKGSPPAWTTRKLLEAWVEFDPDALQTALDEAGSEIGEVTWNLIIIAGGAVRATANAAELPFEAVLNDLWAQLAQKENDDDASRLMRAAVTAWSSEDTAAAEALNDSGAFGEVNPDELVMHLVAVSVMLFERLAEALGESLGDALGGVWRSLGTEDPEA